MPWELAMGKILRAERVQCDTLRVILIEVFFREASGMDFV